jgi:hypothetical protein
MTVSCTVVSVVHDGAYREIKSINDIALEMAEDETGLTFTCLIHKRKRLAKKLFRRLKAGFGASA